jgi:hypothetical protein
MACLAFSIVHQIGRAGGARPGNEKSGPRRSRLRGDENAQGFSAAISDFQK